MFSGRIYYLEQHFQLEIQSRDMPLKFCSSNVRFSDLKVQLKFKFHPLTRHRTSPLWSRGCSNVLKGKNSTSCCLHISYVMVSRICLKMSTAKISTVLEPFVYFSLCLLCFISCLLNVIISILVRYFPRRWCIFVPFFLCVGYLRRSPAD